MNILECKTRVTIQERPSDGLTKSTIIGLVAKIQTGCGTPFDSNCSSQVYEQQEGKINTLITQNHAKYTHDDSVHTTHIEPEIRFCSSSLLRGSDGLDGRIHTTISRSITCSNTHYILECIPRGFFGHRSCKWTTVINERYTELDPSSMKDDPLSLPLADLRDVDFLQLYNAQASYIPELRDASDMIHFLQES
jgi:hypothetical protein